MTKPEMYRRMLTCTLKDFNEGVRMVRQGYGARGIVNETHLTIKQANACFEWVERYGIINPTDVALFLAAPTPAPQPLEELIGAPLSDKSAGLNGCDPLPPKLSAWISEEFDSHGVFNSAAKKLKYLEAFGKTDCDWPEYTPDETRRAMQSRGKGGTVTAKGGEKLCWGYQVAEYFAETRADWKPWQSGLGFRFQSALEALRAKGL